MLKNPINQRIFNEILMYKKIIFRILEKFSYLIWLILLISFTIFITYFYDRNKNNQLNYLNKLLNNIYLNNSFKKITSELNPRYLNLEYSVSEGDTYEKIINNIEISNFEKKLFLKSITKDKNIKVLKVNQKIYFLIDRREKEKIINFTIEIDKKKNILFKRHQSENSFSSKIIEKNLTKMITFKEGVITNSLYSSALEQGIKPNIIIEFARLYGFTIDFQRDIWKDDSFQIIFEEFKNEDGSLIETGDIIYANLNTKETDHQLYKFEYEENKIDYFDENGKSVKKTLMKTPINGARLSSSFGKRKHPILGFTKMHTGTDFAAPKGTPIMASGDGIITKASWCGGGGNCVKIKHNSTYQTVYAHMSKFGRGIKKGVRVKQGQIIGYVGSTGLSTGPHLHYEVIENGRKINSQKLKLPSGKILKGNLRKKFEVNKIKTDVLKSELISKL